VEFAGIPTIPCVDNNSMYSASDEQFFNCGPQVEVAALSGELKGKKGKQKDKTASDEGLTTMLATENLSQGSLLKSFHN